MLHEASDVLKGLHLSFGHDAASIGGLDQHVVQISLLLDGEREAPRERLALSQEEAVVGHCRQP